MQLNSISPALGSKVKRLRVGRGVGSGVGKTCGRGHKGQKARSGGYHKINFEGGQMPIQRRLPKFGFSSRVSKVVDEITLSEINSLDVQIIDLDALKHAGLVTKSIKSVKIILSGEVNKPLAIEGLRLTSGARKQIEALGGTIK